MTKYNTLTPLHDYVRTKGNGNMTVGTMALAQELGTSFHTVVSWLKRSRRPSLAARRLLKIHGISIKT